MRTRNSDCDRVDNAVLKTALMPANNTATSRDNETTWNEADSHKLRKLPIPNDKLYPAFYLKKQVHRALSIKCFLQRFPKSPYQVRETMRAIGNVAVGRLQRILPQAIWSKEDTRDVIRAIEAILEQLPS